MPRAGDLPGSGAKIDGALLDELVAANTGKNAIAFTHKPVLGDNPVAVENRRLIAAAVKTGFMRYPDPGSSISLPGFGERAEPVAKIGDWGA